MITAAYYRDMVTPRPLSESQLDQLVSNAVAAGGENRDVEFRVHVPRIDVARARELLERHDFVLVDVVQAAEAEVTAARVVSARLGTYDGGDFVLDELLFRLPYARPRRVG